MWNLKNDTNEHIKNRPLTFKDLEQDLVIITTNLNTFQTQEFSKFETPDFEIAKAIRISSSMPGLMPPFKYNGESLVDGDLQKASPMWRLTNTLNNSQSRVLEFRLEGDCKNESKSPISFLNTIYSCVTDVATDFVTEIYGKNDKYDCIRINSGNVFFADFNLDKASRRKLMESGYKQTLDYFLQVLPAKKKELENIYVQAYKYLKNVHKGLKSNNVEEVQWWLGDLFILLCENKELVDQNIYDSIVSLKNNLMDSVKTILFLHTSFKNKKELNNETKMVLDSLQERITELKLYLRIPE